MSAAFAGLLCSAFLLTPAAAQTTIWTGTSSTTWSTAGNWNGGTPTGTTTAIFNANTTNDPALGTTAATVGRLNFTGTADAETFSGSGAGVLTINGVSGIGIDQGLVTASSPTFSGPLALGASQTWQATNATSGGLTVSGALNLGGFTLTLQPVNTTNTMTLSGVISNGGSSSLVKTGAGTVILNGAAVNTYTGSTTINAGTLSVNYANLGTPTNLINSSSGLILGGGELSLVGKASGTTAQTFNGVTVNAGASTITRNTNGGTAFNLTLGSITRNAGGTLNFVNSGTGTTTTSTTLTNGLLGTGQAFATLNSTDWASATSSVSGALQAATYSNDSWGASTNTNITTNTTANSLTTNSLRFNSAANRTLTISGTTTLNSGGLLIGSAVSSNVTTITGGNLTVGSNKDLAVITYATGLTTISSNITANGTNALVKSGTGSLTVNGNNTYSGGTYLNQGTLNINSATALGTGTFNINGGNGVTINNNSGAAITLSNNNAQAWNGNFTFTGTNNLNMGTGAVSLNGNRVITVSAGTLAVGGVINDGASTFGLTKSGAGTLTLVGANTFDGGVTLNSGTLNVNNAGSLGTGTLTIAGGTLNNTSGAAITSSSNIAQAWNGDFTFGGSNNLNLGTGTVTLGASRTITVSGSTLTIGGVVDDGTSSFSLTKTGAGALTLGGANTFDGGVTLNGGTLNINSSTALGTGTLTIAAGTTIDNTSGSSVTVSANNAQAWNGNFTFTGTNSLNMGTGVVTLSANRAVTVLNNTLTVGAIGGGFSLTKAGAGTLNLVGANTFTGGTTINGGTLAIAPSGSLTTTNSVTFTGTGSLEYSFSSAARNVGTTTFSAGDDAVKAINTGASAGSLTLGSLAAKATGATGSFYVTATGAGSSKIAITGQSAGTMGAGYFYNTGATTTSASTFAYYDATNGVRALNYGTDANTSSLDGYTRTTMGTVTGNNVKITGPVTAQTSVSIKTLEMGPVGDLTLTTGATLTLSDGGLLKVGSHGASITGGTGITVGSNKELIIRTDRANDALNITTPLLANGTNALVKSGEGSLTLAGASTFTGGSYMNGGTLNINNAAALGTAAGAFTINGGTIDNTSGAAITTNNYAQNWNGDFTFTGTNNLNLGTGAVTLGGNRIVTVNGGVLTIGGVIEDNAATYSLTKNGAGALTLSGNNGYDGGTILNAGTLNLNNAGAIGAAASTFVINGGTIGNTSGGAITLNNVVQTWNGNFTYNSTNTLNMGTGAITLAGSDRTVTVANTAGSLTLGGVIGDGGQGFGLTKAGTGSLILSGAAVNTYTGNTTVNGGTLQLNFANLGTPTNLINSNSTLVLGGGELSVLGKSSGTTAQTFNGLVLNTGGSTITRNTNGGTATNLTVGAITRNTGATLNIASSGTGNVTTTAAVTNGLLGNGQAFATFNSTDWATVSGGNITTATYTNDTWGASTNTNITTNTTASSLTTNSLRFNSAANRSLTVSGTVTLNSGGILVGSGVGSNNTTISGGAITAGSGKELAVITYATGNTTISSNITDSTGTALVKGGTGTLVLSGSSNTYTGGTYLNGGTLIVANTGVLSSGNVTINNNSTLGVSGTRSVTNNITLASDATFNAGSTDSLTVSGNVTGSGLLNKSGTSTVTLNGTNSFSGGIAVNAGTLVAGSNSALGSGNVTVAAGATLSLVHTTGITTTNPNTITLAGSGTNSATLLNTANAGASNRITGNVITTGNATISSTAGILQIGNDSPGFTRNGYTQPTENGYLTIGNGSTLTFTGAGNITVNSRIQDFAGQSVVNTPAVANAGNVEINMSSSSARVTYVANANSYTGTTTVKNGELYLDTITNGSTAPHDPVTDSFHAINGAVVIGGAGSTGATVKLGATNEAMHSNTTVNIGLNGTLDLGIHGQTIDALTISNAGRVVIGTGGHLYLNNDVSVAGAAGSTAQVQGSAGFLEMTLFRASAVDGTHPTYPDATRTFTVTNPGAENTVFDFSVQSVVQSGNLVKAGNGVMNLSNSGNTYTGTTTVSGGILNISAGTSGGTSALGANGFDDTKATYVQSGATLQLQGGITVTDEKIHIAGDGYTGVADSGAINNKSGNNTIAGSTTNAFLNLSGNSTINSTSGLLTIQTNITSDSNNKALTFGGAGNITVDGFIITGSGATTTVTKTGSGRLILAGNTGLSGSSYQGNTTINSGVVQVQHSDALGAAQAGTFTEVKSGAALEINKTGGSTNLNISSEEIRVAGTGIANDGAIRNLGATNTLGGPIKLVAGGDVRINSDAGSLIMSGGVTNNTTATKLIVGGAGTTTISGTLANTGGGLTWDGSGAFNISGNIGSSGNTIGDVLKSGSGTMTFGGSSSRTGYAGKVNLTAGNTIIGTGSTTLLNTEELTSSGGVSTSLQIASGGTVAAVFNEGISQFNGVMHSSSQGTLRLTSSLASSSGLQFGTSFDASGGVGTGLTLELGGSSVGHSFATQSSDFFRLELSGVHVSFDTIHITGDTIIDFNDSNSTWLSSKTLIIDQGVNVVVTGWHSIADNTALSTVWFATSGVQFWNPNTNSLISSLNLSGGTLFGNTPLNQITFNSYDGMTTTWVSGNSNGWFDKEIRPTPAPEPATYGAIFISGCLGLLGWRRYQRRKAAAQA